MSIRSTVFARTPEQVIHVWQRGYREATPADVQARKTDHTGKVPTVKATDVIGCSHTDCRLDKRSYGGDGADRSATPAVSAWVASNYGYDFTNERPSDNVVGVVFYCARHTGQLRSVRSRTSGYGFERVAQVAGSFAKDEVQWDDENPWTLVTVAEAAANPGAQVVRAIEEVKRRRRAVEQARRQYVRDHRAENLQAFHSERDTSVYFGGTVKVEDADEYGRRYISVGGIHYNQRGNPAAIRQFAAKLLEAADLAEQETPTK